MIDLNRKGPEILNCFFSMLKYSSATAVTVVLLIVPNLNLNSIVKITCLAFVPFI